MTRNGAPIQSNGAHPLALPARAARPRPPPSLFDFRPPQAPLDEPAPIASVEPPPAAAFPPPPRPAEPIHPPDLAAGAKAKAKDILAAIATLKRIEEGRRAATEEERRALLRFGGFGPVALSIFPDPVTGRYKEGWQAVGEELRGLLTDEEYDSAKRTTVNAFYTSSTVIRAMFEAIKRLGVPDAATVLEPGCGSGRFLYLAPKEMHFIGVEMDRLSGRIARALHPEQDIRIENFRDSRLPVVDAAIGNVPFADVKLEHAGRRFSLHDYFLAKSVDALRPGGVLALVTSHYTLDKQNAAIREYLAGTADFVGAIRLPSDAFKREGTSVVTDIVFLRKRAPSDPARHADPDWLHVAPLEIEGTVCAVNRYFLAHPEMVLGAWSRKDTLYGEGYSVRPTGDLARQLGQAVGGLPEAGPLEVSRPREAPRPFTPPAQESHIGEGSFFIGSDRRIRQVVDGEARVVVYCGSELWAGGALLGRRVGHLIELRDLARRVLQSQNDGWPEEARDGARTDLKRSYAAFVSAYGPVNKTTFSETRDGTVVRRMPNVVKFREDPDAMLVLALEDYDEVTGKATKAPIMSRDVVGRAPPVTHVESAEEGLLVSLNQLGRVDLPFVARLYGKPEEAIVAELGDLVFHDPESRTWQTRDAYLSGNVREKLTTARLAGDGYARNAEALAAVQPEDVLPGDIDANLGAPWIPESDIQGFAAQLFNVGPSSVQVGHLKKDAVWSVSPDFLAETSVAATCEYGTARANGTWLLELALNMRTPVIYDTFRNGDKEERVVNQEDTLSAREKQKAIKERFRQWLFADPERTERLVRLYNDTYNNLRPRLFDGSHLAFPGMSQAIALRQHQKDAVWRCMSAGNTLLAHAVGAGKSYLMAATAMKMKQAGLVKKPLFAVPNHLLEQFAREFLHVYPNARLLVAAKEDFTKERRKHLTARVASGEWDGIIVTHSGFERIGMSKAYQEEFLREQIREYDQLLKDGAGARAGRAGRNIIKTIEKQKAAREQRLQDLLAREKKDDGLVFDQLGVDHLFVDEAHYFKNLETPTKMDRVAGIQTGGSERAFDLYMKVRYLHRQHPGHGVTFATGTPISNTMVELYTMQRYLDAEGLVSRGIEHFDGWAATFGEVVDTMEISPDGKTLKPRSRFSKFVNLPELQQMFRSFADVQTAGMLNLPRPGLAGGKARVGACPMSDEQARLQEDLVARYERLRTQKVDPREDNALAITTDGRKLALDARLLLGSAGDFPGSKVNALVENVLAIWRRTATERAAQMVFCDMGVTETPWGYSVYEEVLAKLVKDGIPREQVAAVGDADSDAKKQALFEKVRSGQVRVLLGSTQKMGTGTNVQKRLVALHHLDAPWKPAEVEQREGRILRQGNEMAEVTIYRYVTEGSFDAYMWQALETKARFIAQVMTGENAARQAEDVGGQELSYAEVKAIASGNPAVLTLAEADADMHRLSVLKKNHADEQYLARRSLRELPERIERLRERLSGLAADQTTVNARPEGALTINGRAVAREDAVAALGGRLEWLPKNGCTTQCVELGAYRGLHFGLVLHPFDRQAVYLEGKVRREECLSRDHQGPRAVLNALERLATGYAIECGRVRQDLAVAEGQLRDYQAKRGAPFEYEAYLTQLAWLRDQLRARLSDASPEPAGAQGPTVAELAEQIRTLKAAQAVETTGERVGARRWSAEEPVTTRLRRETETAPPVA